MKLLFTSLLLITILFSGIAQNRDKAFEINSKLGRGINYGNMFEAPSENAWGNKWKPQYPTIIADLGFNHVRVPIRWEPADRSSSKSPYNIYSTFLNRIKEVVDSSLNAGLYAVINMHHHEALYEDPTDQEQRFLSMWAQISEFFKDYPDSLLFELLNEPHGNITPEVWNDLIPKALDTIRITNPERVVLIGTAEYGGLGGLPYLELPDDDNIILTVHYYNPFQFTHQGASWVGEHADDWLGTKWQDTESDRDIMRQEFAPLKAISEAENIPVHIGEFGAYSTADIISREKWTTFLSRYFEELGWSWAYWEFSAGFGIYNPTNKTYNQELVDALLHNEMPEPAKYQGNAIYESNFSSSTNGWNANFNGGSQGNMKVVDNALEVTINSTGTETWHIQLLKGNIKLEKGKKYRYSFKAKADGNRSSTSYIGKRSDPWTAYSGYNSPNITDTLSTFTYIFEMNSPTDSYARMVFDLGTSDVDFMVTDIKIEEVILVPPTTALVNRQLETQIYPNPATNKLVIKNAREFNEAIILNIKGSVLKKAILRNESNELNIEDLPSGMYIIQLTGENNTISTKFIKR